DVHREWLLIKLRSPWDVNGLRYPAGMLLAARLDAFMKGERAFTVLFAPTANTSLSGFAWTRHHLMLMALEDVVGKLTVLTPPQAGGDWKREALAGAPELSAIHVVETDPDVSDEYFLLVNGYLTPASLQRGVLDDTAAETLKQAPSFFDAS